MIYESENLLFIDTLLCVPSTPSRINNITIEDDISMNHLKVQNSDKITDEKIRLKNKASTELYEYLLKWEKETLLNAFFTRNLEAGNITGDGAKLIKIQIKRLSEEDNYRLYETIGEVKYDDNIPMYIDDTIIKSGVPYFYSILPITEEGNMGGLQKRLPGLNRYEFSWLIDATGEQIQLSDIELTDIKLNTKDGIVETLGGKMPYVNRLSASDYKTFGISGIIASELDFEGHIKKSIKRDKDKFGEQINSEIRAIFKEKYGYSMDKVNNSQLDYNYEREFREKVADILNNGEMKLFKSPTEGLIPIKLTEISLEPIQSLGRTLYRFSAQATEVAEFDIETRKLFREAVVNNE